MQEVNVYILATFTEGEKVKKQFRILMATGLLNA
jgi:hypothetical protein